MFALLHQNNNIFLGRVFVVSVSLFGKHYHTKIGFKSYIERSYTKCNA